MRSMRVMLMNKEMPLAYRLPEHHHLNKLITSKMSDILFTDPE